MREASRFFVSRARRCQVASRINRATVSVLVAVAALL